MPTKAQTEWAEKREEKRRQRQRFVRARQAEKEYSRKLQQLARQIGSLVRGFDYSQESSYSAVEALLRDYARIISPWARATAVTMLADVSNRDAAAWREHSREMGIAIREEIGSAPTGDILRQLQAQQVQLITSLPLEAAQRIHEIGRAHV